MNIGEVSSAASSAATATEAAATVANKADKQQEQIVGTILDGLEQGSRQGFPTGHGLNATA